MREGHTGPDLSTEGLGGSQRLRLPEGGQLRLNRLRLPDRGSPSPRGQAACLPADFPEGQRLPLPEKRRGDPLSCRHTITAAPGTPQPIGHPRCGEGGLPCQLA